MSEILPDGLKPMDGPVHRFLGNALPTPYIGGLLKEGIGWMPKEIECFDILYSWANKTEGALMNIVEQLNGNYSEAEQLWSDYEVKLKSFRSSVKNDVSSLEASARKTTTAVQKMQKAYSDVITTMNSEEMATATDNAERLAAAMATLANLQSHELTLKVEDK